MNLPKFLRPRQAARYLAISESSLNKLRVFGGGPAYSKRGRSIIYSVDDLDAWVAAGRRHSTSDEGGANVT